MRAPSRTTLARPGRWAPFLAGAATALLLTTLLQYGAVQSPPAAAARAPGPAPAAVRVEPDFFADYEALHRTRPSRIITCTPFGGLGNRLMYVSSCYLLAVLTRRALVLNWSQTQFAQPGFDWQAGTGLPLGDDATVDALTDAQIRERVLPYYGIPSNTRPRVIGCNNPRELDKFQCVRFLCDTDLDSEYSEPWLALTGNNYMAHLLWLNPHLRPRIERLFANVGGVAQMGGHLLRHLFRPVPRLQALIDRFADKHFAPSTGPVVGLQIRFEENRVLEKDKPEVTSRLGGCLSVYTADLPVGARSPTFFLAADSEETRTAIMAALGDRFQVVHFDQASLANVARHEKGWFKDWDHAVVDNWLLSRADDLYVTSLSSFGQIAAARAEIKPFAINRAFKMCSRAMRSEPCEPHWVWNHVAAAAESGMIPCFSMGDIVEDRATCLFDPV